MPDNVKDRKETPLPLSHLGLVVNNIEEWIDKYSRMGIRPWKLMEAGDITDTTVADKPEHFSLKCAIASLGPIELELVQPVEGKDVCRKFLDNGREGFHHILFHVDNLQKAISELEKFGLHIAQSGKDFGKVPWAYLDSDKALGLPVLELIEKPKCKTSTSSKKARRTSRNRFRRVR